jgi:hypothetical protein
MAALANSPAARRIATLTILGPRRLDASDQFVQLIGCVSNVLRQATNDIERLFRLPTLDKLVDEILIRLQGLQKARELRAGIVKFFGGVLSLPLQALPLID